MISFTTSGSFDRTEKFLRRILSGEIYRVVERYAQNGTNALREATPVDTSDTANSWYHEITVNSGGISITWSNSNVENGFPVAIMLQYGHGTGTGGYVSGRDYINPAIKPIFDEIERAVWQEVTRG